MKKVLPKMVLLAVASGTIFVSFDVWADDKNGQSTTLPFAPMGEAFANGELDNTNYHLTIATVSGKTNFEVGERIDLRIKFENASTNQVIFAETFPLGGIHAYVTKTNGLPVSVTPFGKAMWGPTAAMSFSILAPGQITMSRPSSWLDKDSDYPLDRMFDMGIPGTYDVIVPRFFGDFTHKKPVLATSNVLKITIR